MDKNLEYYLTLEFESKAQIIDSKFVEVIAPDGEVFRLLSQIGRHTNDDIRKYQLHVLEEIFDKNFSDNKDEMINGIMRDAILNGISLIGINSGNRYPDRTRIGNRIKQIRLERGMEARDLATLVGIDPASLSRIENGKYSVGFDILSKIAISLGKKIDFVDI